MGRGLHRVRELGILSLLVGFSCMPFAAHAQTEAPQVLGLDQLITMAVERSPEINEAEQDVRSAQSDLAQAKAGKWAQVDMVGIVGPAQDAKTPVVQVDFQPGASRLTGRIVDRDTNDIGIFGRLEVNIVQPLFTFGKISHRKDAAAAGVEVQRAAKEKKRGEVIRGVKELYFAYIVANQGKGAAKDTDDFIQDARRRIKSMIQHGSKNVDPSDLYRLDAFEAEVKQFKAKADSGATMAYLALKKAVDYPADKDFRVDVTELPKDTRALGTREEYIGKALNRRPEFDQLRKGIEAQKSMVEASRADLYPSIFLAAVGSFAGAPNRDELDISYFNDDFNHVEGGIILGSHWHFDFGIGRGKVNKAKAEYQKLLYTKEFAERNIPLEVAKYYQDTLEARESYEAYEKGSIAARKWIVASFSNFDLGVGTAKDMFDAIDRYGKNQGEYLLALYKYHVGLASLSYAIGEYRL